MSVPPKDGGTIMTKPFELGQMRCQGCGVLYERRRHRNGRLEHPDTFVKRIYCSMACLNHWAPRRILRGPDNPQWKGDNLKWRESGHGRCRKMYALGPCAICGKQAIDRHHKDGNTVNNAPENVQILCRRCHMTVDGRMPAFVAAKGGRRTEPLPPFPCVHCGRVVPRNRRWYGRCGTCNEYWRAHGVERPQHLIDRAYHQRMAAKS